MEKLCVFLKTLNYSLTILIDYANGIVLFTTEQVSVILNVV